MYQQSLTSTDIASRLRMLCQEKNTGTLHIIENGHLLGQISLQAGEIIALSAQKKQGLNALPQFVDIRNGGVAFAAGPLATARMSLPATADILAILDGANRAADLHAAEPEPEPAPLELTALSKMILEQTLKEFVGPIADMLCADCFRAATTLSAAIDTLAGEIPDDRAATRFREQVHRRLAA